LDAEEDEAEADEDLDAEEDAAEAEEDLDAEEDAAEADEDLDAEVDVEKVAMLDTMLDAIEVTLPGPTDALVVATVVGVAVEALVFVPVREELAATPCW